jgi:hypothetical protein
MVTSVRSQVLKAEGVCVATVTLNAHLLGVYVVQYWRYKPTFRRSTLKMEAVIQVMAA